MSIFIQQSHTRTATRTRGSSGSSGKRRTRHLRFFLFGKKAEREQEEPAFDTIGGVYSNDTLSFTSTSHSKSLRSIDTHDTHDTRTSSPDSSSHSSASDSTPTHGWISSGSQGHHKGSPLVAKRALVLGNGRRGLVVPEDDQDEDALDQAEALGQIMLRARQLPKDSWDFASNHVMINAERTKRMISPLVRDTVLDKLARAQAADMALSNRLYHSDPSDLELDIDAPLRRLGENVTRGSTLEKIHKSMMNSAADKNNISDRRFTHMGMGTAKASDGTLYLCQLFRG
jgi:uncharacterized protein YkwD